MAAKVSLIGDEPKAVGGAHGRKKKARAEEYGVGTDELELHQYFCEYETTIGLRSTFPEQREAIAELRSAAGVDGETHGLRRRKPTAVAIDQRPVVSLGDGGAMRPPIRDPDPCDERDADGGEGPAVGDRVPDERRAVVDDGALRDCVSTGANFARPKAQKRAVRPEHCDRLADVVPTLTWARHVYHRLKALIDRGDGRHVTVLWRLYGPQPPTSGRQEFGEYSNLAGYTDAAEAARDELACERSSTRSDSTQAAVDAEIPWMKRASSEFAEEEFWHQAGVTMRLERERAMVARKREAYPRQLELMLASGGALDDLSVRRAAKIKDWLRKAPARAVDIECRLRASRAFMARLIEVFVDGASGSANAGLRAKLGAIAQVDREVTIADAIDWMLRSADRGMTPDEKSARVTERMQFISDVRVQAMALKRDAHAAYSQVKRGS